MFLKDKKKSTEQIAQELLGYLLVSETEEGVTSGWIVETEAYTGVKDAAAHSYNGKNTPRIRAMFREAGTIYTYQMHKQILLNVVTQEEGTPQAVLIRAVEPVIGGDLMEVRRNKSGIERTNGPGKLTMAMGISMDVYGSSIEEPPVFINFSKKKTPLEIQMSPRIGIHNKGEWTDAHLRYTVKGNPHISKKRGKVNKEHFGWRTD